MGKGINKNIQTEEMFELGLIKAGQTCVIYKAKEDKCYECKIIDGKEVEYEGATMSYNKWGMLIYSNWKGFNAYNNIYVKEIGATLDTIRQRYSLIVNLKKMANDSYYNKVLSNKYEN